MAGWIISETPVHGCGFSRIIFGMFNIVILSKNIHGPVFLNTIRIHEDGLTL